MSGFMQEAESLEKDFSNQSGDQTQGSNDQSSNDQSSSSSSGGGLLQDAETGGKDVMIDQEANSFMNKEGIPSGADGLIDSELNKEL